ncbi:hypothetical protein P3X46_010184 [Hevea brasiliensis]|uniref:Uncharacterized protein n=1 Tax=Hevea brasiliensis TaxID=3981 RepID=A0ABQ9MFL1_HEVBR|nr:uncharacterized protein LOC110670109 [Hevea brasiliensis]KAJ9178287.1 hypothetical protein P3X46_010184 [Hevea brasiliensis]
MTPAQPLMDIHPDYEHHSTKVEVDIDDETILAKSDGMRSKCVDNCGETVGERGTLLDEQTKPMDPEDVEVDIITYKNSKETRSAGPEDPDATEYSSSFANTFSDDEKCSGRSETEVESQFLGDSYLASPYDAFSSIFKTRKKLTNHWRSFIRPLMWRCKWTELKIKEIESQALKYARKLAAYEQRKHSRIYQSTFEDCCSKLSPFSNQCYRRRAIKRRKRKRIEDTTDTSSYMLHHSLFSYLDNKRSNPDGSSMVDDFDNAAITECHADCSYKFGNENEQLSFELEDDNNFLEQVLWKIEIMQSQIHKLRNQLDVVMSENATAFSSSENPRLLAPCDGHTSSAASPTFPAGNGDTMSIEAMHNANQQISGCDIGDLIMPDSAISSCGETIEVPDLIESTVGMLAADDVTFHQPQIGDSCEDIVDNVLTHTESTKGERDTFIGTDNQLLEKHHEQEKGEEESTNPCPVTTLEPDPTAKTTFSEEQSTLKSCLASDFQFPKNKRKRGERKAGSGGWNKKCSGEPDSQ